MKYNFRLYFDMDDTLVDFGCDRHINDVNEVIREKGFFRNLSPLPFLEEINKLAAMCPENVYIVSACVDSPYCIDEKIDWLKEYLPCACKTNVIFTKVGENKTDFVKAKIGHDITKYDILIDDYSKNLKDWESEGGTAIKFKNSFNAVNPSKYKYIIKDFSELIDTILKIRESLGD